MTSPALQRELAGTPPPCPSRAQGREDR